MKKALVFVLAAVFALPLQAYDWPAPDVKARKVFGQRTGTLVIPGMELETTASELTCPEKSELVFSFQPQGQRFQNLPSALGGFAVMAQEDNLRTMVTNMTPSFTEGKTAFLRGEPLGRPQPIVGSTFSRHRVFVFDQQLGELVNPLLVFPLLPDTRSPIILDVKIVPENGGSSSSLFARSNFTVGYWTLFLDVSDPATMGGDPNDKTVKAQDVQRGIYFIGVYLNGAEIMAMNLNSLQEKGGKWLIKGLNRSLDDILVSDKEWNLGQLFLNQGTNILEVVVRDFKGNETGKTFHLMGNRS